MSIFNVLHGDQRDIETLQVNADGIPHTPEQPQRRQCGELASISIRKPEPITVSDPG